jgi:hypothetical protein
VGEKKRRENIATNWGMIPKEKEDMNLKERGQH